MRSVIRKIAAVCAMALMLSNASPVFAEGSKEFNEVAAGSTNTADYPAHRPYFEWRERSQFGMPSKNVMYVYAEEGETIFFGSDVTKASDRSIEAIVRNDISFDTELDSTGQAWSGSSIAVTLPTEADETVAFDPNGKGTNIFADGSVLTGADSQSLDREKVYLFKPTPSGKGHIMTPTMEKNGPDGVVQKNAETATTEGYVPLSFVAPVTGTYSFRFLSKDYSYGDGPDTALNVMTRNEAFDTADTVYDAGTAELSPVAESYTWDLTKLKGDAALGTAYKEDTILGYYPVGADGTDYDNNYYYDLKVYATIDKPSMINSGGLSLSDVHDSNLGYANLTTGYLGMIPAWDGNIKVTFVKNSSAEQYSAVAIYQPNNASDTYHSYSFSTGAEESVTLDIKKDVFVYIYAEYGSADITSIEYTVSDPAASASRAVDKQWSTSIPSLVSAWDITVAKYENGVYNAQPGRVWMDIMFLNAGYWQTSIYPQFNVLTKDGFLYDVNLNGIQPWSFVFYSNNRGFLLDRWSLYSNPQLAYGDENAQSSTAALQALEHSFYSASTQSDVGPAPVHKEVDGDGNPVMNMGNQMESPILGNYIPVDKEKDVTHKLFFNEPDAASLSIYTEEKALKTVADADTEYAGLLEDIVYTGLGNSANNEDADIHYGTIGIGGRFDVTISAEEAKKLDALGSSSISILLDFSSYELDETGVPVPVLDSDNEWKEIDDLNNRSDAEKNNMVSLSATIDNDATVEKTYTLSWNGRDAYGNVVPAGIYSQVIKSYVEMGMAHFPILDAEHSPNGIKIKMLNEISGNEKKRDYVYYNNEAVSPLNNPDAPSAWYYTGKSSNAEYPNQIGDGLNKIGGVSTYFDDATKSGAMVFGSYGESETGYGDSASGYGNFAALDIWSKYEIKAAAELKIGVNPVEEKKAYVSFVSTDGEANIANTPFDVSHVNYAGEREETNTHNKGLNTIYGNTISTGFITAVSTTAEGIANNCLIWEITIPVSGKINDYDEEIHDAYIKIPTEDIGEEATFTSEEDAAESEYLAYEMFSGMFSDYMPETEESLGDEYVPDWEVDAELSSGSDPGIMELPGDAEYSEVGLSDEMYFELAELDAATVGDYLDKDWEVTINAGPEAVLTDAEGVQVNKGDIYKINSFKLSEGTTEYVKIKVAHRVPVITGGSAVTVGLIIDNLYAPAAKATAKYSSSGWDSLHEITSILYGGENDASVQSSTYAGYVKNPQNEYNIFDNVDTGLVMHLTFDEEGTGSGTFEALGGAVKEMGTVSYAEGKNGNAVIMGYGESNYLELPDGILNGATSASVSFWVQQGNSFGWPFMTTPLEGAQGWQNEKYIGVLLDAGQSTITAERYYSNAQERPAHASASGSFGEWTYVTINYEPTKTSIYINGVLAGDPVSSEVNLSNIFTETANTCIGHANWGAGEGFAGMIDEFRIYNRTLSESEIQSLYNEYK